MNYTLKLFCDFLWRSASLREGKESPHTEFWIPVLFITTLAQSGRLAISLARDSCCLTSYCFWVKWETWVWIFLSFCEIAHFLGHVFIEHWGSHHYYFSSVQHTTQKSLVIEHTTGEKGKEESDINLFLYKKITLTCLFQFTNEEKKNRRSNKWKVHPVKIWKRKKNMERYTINSEKEVYLTQTAGCCKSRGLRILPTVSPQTRSHTLDLRRCKLMQNPPSRFGQRVYFVAEDTICWNELKLWSVAVSF